MYPDHLIQEKVAAAAAEEAALRAKNTAAGIGSFCTKAVEEPVRPSLQEMVWSQVRQAEREARRHQRLAELGILLDKNPEVARILDLVEEVRGFGRNY